MRLSFLCTSDLTCLLSVLSSGSAVLALLLDFLVYSSPPSSGGDTGAQVPLGEPLHVRRARALQFSICAALSFTSLKGASFGNTMLLGGGARRGNFSSFQMSYITHNWGAVRSTCSLILPICSCFSLFSPCRFLSFI